jgi:uncharacterized protein YjbJ (UPF0337 family)
MSSSGERSRLAPDVHFEVERAVLRTRAFEEKMTNSTRQQIEGDLHDAKGTAKEAEGKLTKDPDLEAEGRIEKVAGIVQKKLGKLEKMIGK